VTAPRSHAGQEPKAWERGSLLVVTRAPGTPTAVGNAFVGSALIVEQEGREASASAGLAATSADTVRRERVQVASLCAFAMRASAKLGIPQPRHLRLGKAIVRDLAVASLRAQEQPLAQADHLSDSHALRLMHGLCHPRCAACGVASLMPPPKSSTAS